MRIIDQKGEAIPFEISEISPEMEAERKKYFTDERVISIGPKKYILCEEYKKIAAEIYTLELRSDDVFVMGTSRAGTNWTQELVWMIANDLNFEKAKNTKARERFPFLERSMLFPQERKDRVRKENSNDPEFLKFLDIILQPPRQLFEGLASPRFVKTHLPLSLLPPNLLDTAKVVYVARDPRDVMVSTYNFLKGSTITEFKGDLKAHCDLFMKDALVYMPYLEHVKEAWEKRNHPNMLFLFYEDLCKDLQAVIRRVANFFGKNLTEEQVKILNEYLCFNNFKKNKSEEIEQTKKLNGDNCGNAFIRKGKAGGWRDYFDEEMKIKADLWIKENLYDADLKFPEIWKV